MNTILHAAQMRADFLLLRDAELRLARTWPDGEHRCMALQRARAFNRRAIACGRIARGWL